MSYRCKNWQCSEAMSKTLHCNSGYCDGCGEILEWDGDFHGLCCNDPECHWD